MRCDACKSPTRKATQRVTVVFDDRPTVTNDRLALCDRCLAGSVRAYSALTGATVSARQIEAEQ